MSDKANWTISRQRVTHVHPCRPTPRNPTGERITHPWQWVVTEPDGYERFFDTKAEALAWIKALAEQRERIAKAIEALPRFHQAVDFRTYVPRADVIRIARETS